MCTLMECVYMCTHTSICIHKYFCFLLTGLRVVTEAIICWESYSASFKLLNIFF